MTENLGLLGQAYQNKEYIPNLIPTAGIVFKVPKVKDR